MAWRGQAALARRRPLGRRVPRLADHTGRLFSFGNERAAALGVPRAGGPPGEGRGARRVKSRPSGSGDRCAMWHTSREDRHPLGRDAGTVARSALARAPIEPCPAGSRPTGLQVQ